MTRHLHLSVQSGSDMILQRMGRRHTVQRIREIHEYFKTLLAAAGGTPPMEGNISWDVICGFPGETEELFAETLALARELKPAKIHAFPFSARPGTAAAMMTGKVTRKAAKERLGELLKE